MGVETLISEEQYLHSSYEPDCEYEDGAVIERKPVTLESEIHTPAGSRNVEDRILRVEGTPIEVPLAALEEE